MPVFFTRLKVGHPEPLKPPEDWEGSWRIYTVCTTSNPKSCTTRTDVSKLELKDKLAARQAYVTFTNRAQTGQNLKDLYDDKQCHEAHSFKLTAHDDHEEKIFRIRSGVIRLYFLYLPDRRIILLKTWPKRKDKLSQGEKLELEALARIVLDSVLTDGFELRKI